MLQQRHSLCSAGVNPRKTRLIDEYAVGSSLLDIGCGNGLYPLAAQRFFLRILQIDVVNRRFERAQTLPFLLLEASLIDTIKETFSTVLVFDIIEHLDDDANFLDRVRSICSGVVIGSVPGDNDSQLQAIGLTFVHHTDKTHRRAYSEVTLRKLLSSSGFKDVLIFPQYADGLVAAAYALRTETLLGKLFARIITQACRGLCWIGIFKNRSVSDWFFVAR
jgi:hypothetical protein